MSLAAYHEEMQHNVDGRRRLRENLTNAWADGDPERRAGHGEKKRAQEAARIKSEFLAANMSHELRTRSMGYDRLYPPDAENRSQRYAARP
ncbi:hypothetical protein MJ575_23340 [Klebsiella pneumoniae]|nr:hypothetical protein MJ575_23340 [Klebsiella pneumoniae]